MRTHENRKQTREARRSRRGSRVRGREVSMPAGEERCQDGGKGRPESTVKNKGGGRRD